MNRVSRGVAQPEKVLAVLAPDEQEQLNAMLRRMLQLVDRPGLLNTPKSAESGDTATERRSRFTPDAIPE